MEIGKRIKELRLSAGMTQEQLAQQLNISAQAVSKWETDTTTPDIQLLPKLSVLFGVSIDSLFSMTDDDRMERIENSIYDVRYYSEEEFRQHERWLQVKQKEEKFTPKATLLLAMLYNKRAEEYHALASPMAREALRLNPTVKDAHNAIFDAEHGAYSDWYATNHYKTIAFYKQFLKEHPEDRRNYYWLLDLLIADGRTGEAREVAEQMRQVADTYHYEMYMGQICKQECDLPSALAWWKKMTEKAPDAWVVWFEYADQMARLCRYDEAIAAYEKASPLRPRPQFVDAEESLADIYEIQGEYEMAIEMHRRIIEIMAEQWGFTEGESVDIHYREIKRLQNLMK